MWFGVFLIALLHGGATAMAGCVGYVEKPEGMVPLKFKDTKIQLTQPETGKVLAETEVAPSTGFFHLSYNKQGSVIMRLVAPDGWVFEPKEKAFVIDGVSDVCSKGDDILFNLIGFRYTGAITSPGSELGPAGVAVKLISTEGELTAEAITQEGGGFELGPVLPGNYKLAASHNTLASISKNEPIFPSRFSLSEPVDLALGVDCRIPSAPAVIGYQISGACVESGSGVGGVELTLFRGGVELAQTVSNGAGNFVFDQIAVGEYSIRASFGEFTIEPAQQEITVSVDDFDLVKNFEITGITVQGRLETIQGGPIAGTVSLGSAKVSSDAEGNFRLEKITPGRHEFHIFSDDYDFDPLVAEINSKTARLGALTPQRVSVCPTVDYSPAEIRIYKNGDVVQTTRSQRCFFLAPGDYVVGVVPVSSHVPVHFTPTQIPLTVQNEPIKSGLAFTRLYRPMSVLVTCLKDSVSCSPEQLAATLTNQNGDSFDLTVVKEGDGIKVSHAGLTPDQYTLKLRHEAWCFEGDSASVSLPVQIDPENPLTTVQLGQTGHSFIVKTEDTITVEIDGKEKELNKGDNRFCFRQPTGLKLTPKSCHVFDQESYTLSAGSPVTLKRIATRQAVVVNVAEEIESLELEIRFNDQVKSVIVPVESGRAIESLVIKPGVATVVRPISSTLFVAPNEHEVREVQQGCLPELRFDALAGLFVSGSTVPSVPGARATLKRLNSDEAISSIDVNQNGKFEFGPLNPHNEYDVTLDHSDYRFQQRTADYSNTIFDAFELANVEIEVNDEAGKPLADVVVVLSGPSRFRSVEKLDESANGKIEFERLEPGEYYLALEKKEFRFEPNHIELQFAGRRTVRVTAVRYQYSAIGALSSLSDVGLDNAVVEAVGLQSSHCADHFEETTTDEHGGFKILGLSQDCTYTISVKASDFLISPAQHQIQIGSADVTDIEFTAFKVISNTRISGNVAVCSTCPLKGISATLYAVNEEDNSRAGQIERIDINEKSGTFFNFKPIDQDSQKVELVVTGPHDTQTVSMFADRPHKHRSFTYTHTSDETVIAEKPGGQLGAALLLLVILVSTVVTKRDLFLAQLTKSAPQQQENQATTARARRR